MSVWRLRTWRRAARPTSLGRANAGHTLVELVVVTTLMALLTALIAQAWKPIGHSTANLREEAVGLTELRLSLAYLRGDLGAAKRLSEPVRDVLHIEREPYALSRYGMGEPSADLGVNYSYSEGTLLREDRYTGESFAVARGLSGFTVETQANGGARIVLSVKAGAEEKKLEVVWTR
jgi:type II secretory pathway pseudopilin PulG